MACFSGGGTVQIWPLSAFGDTAEAQERSWIGGHALDEGTLAFVQNDAAWLWDPVECRVIGPFGGDKTQDPQAWPDVLDRLPGGTMLACSRGRVIKNDGRHGRLWFVNSRDGQPQQALTDDSDAYKVVGDQYLLIDRRSQPSEVWALSPPALKRRLEGGTAGVMGGRSLTWSLRCQALKLLSQDNTVVLEEAENLSKGWSEPWISNCRPLPDNRFTAWGRQAVQIRNSDGCLIREEAIPGHVKIWLPNDTLLYIVEEVIYHWDTRHDPVPLEGYRARWAAGQALSHLFMASRNLLLGRSGGQVGLWSLQTGACVHRFPVPADSQFTALDHPDVVVTWERESTAGLRFWQFGEDAPQASTTEFTAPITAVVALGNGRCLTLEQGGHTTIWSADGALIEALELGKDTVVKIEPYGGGAYFVSHQRVVKTQSGWTEYTNCRVRIWEPGGPVREYLGHSAKVLGLLPVNTHTALSWDDGGVLHSFDPHTMERKASAPNHDRSTPTLLVDGRVFTGFNDRENLGWRHTKVFALWDPETGTSERVVEARGACHLETGAVAFWTESDLVRVFDDTLEPAYELRGVLGYQPLGDGEMVAEIVGASSPQMVVCRADGFETFEGECRGLYRVNALDSDTICTTHFNGTIQLWSRAARKALLQLKPDHEHIRGVIIAGDERLLTWGDTDAKLWERDTGRSVATLTGHTGISCAGRFGADEILTWDWKVDELRSWDAQSGMQRLATTLSEAQHSHPARYLLAKERRDRTARHQWGLKPSRRAADLLASQVPGGIAVQRLSDRACARWQAWELVQGVRAIYERATVVIDMVPGKVVSLRLMDGKAECP